MSFVRMPVLLSKTIQQVMTVIWIACMQALMVEPMIAADGHTYEKSAIQIWLQQHDTSPVTGIALAHMRIVPNHLIKGAIKTSQGL